MSIDAPAQPLSPTESTGSRLPLNLRLRRDLIVVEQVSSRQKKRVVKDPLSLDYFHFSEQEWFVLECLRQPTTLPEIQSRFCQQFPPLKISLEELKVFLARVTQDNLVIVEDKLGMGAGYIAQASRRRQSERKFRWFQVLYIRFRGIDPTGILSSLRPVGKIIFHPVFMSAAAIAMCLTIAFIVVQFEHVYSRLPMTIELVTFHNLLLMILVTGIVKMFHELGHGMACQQLGGECRELGILLLAFVPCLYCNVSDTWLEPRRSRRMMVSAAGIYVELLLAVGCFFLWYGSHPGTLNSICLNVVLISSINTVFINGNPLLRYDGYYLLADLVNVPNLAQQARSSLTRSIKSLLFRNMDQSPLVSRRGCALLAYALASLAYRVFVIGAILFGIHVITRAWDVEVIGNLAIIVALTGILLPQCYQLRRIILTGFGEMKLKRVSATFLAASGVGILGVIGFVPLRHEINAPVVVELRDPAIVFAPRDGRLEWTVRKGDSVNEGDLIARIENLDLMKRRGLLETAIGEKSTRLENLQIRARDEPEQVQEIPILQSELTELKKQLDSLMSELARLELRSPRTGVVFSGPSRSPEHDPRTALNQWHGSLLDPVNSGCFVDRGQVLCMIGNPLDLRAAIYVDEDWVDEVAEGTKVRFCFDHSSQIVVDGRVASVVGESVAQVPESLVTNRLISVTNDNSGRVIPAQPVFRADCRFVGTVPVVLPGSTGNARVLMHDKTLLQRIGRFINRTFRMDW